MAPPSFSASVQLLLAIGIFCCITHAAANLTEFRSVSGYTGIQSAGPFVITVNLTGSEGVQIDAYLDDANVTKALLTYVEKGALIIRFAWPYDVDVGAFTNLIHISISAININSIVLSGSGSIQVNSVLAVPGLSIVNSGSGNITVPAKSGDLSVVMSGSGNVILLGSTSNLNGVLSGSGGLGGNDLVANVASFSLYGSGNAVINIKSTLSVVMLGSGMVKYRAMNDQGTPPTINIVNMGPGSVINIA